MSLFDKKDRATGETCYRRDVTHADVQNATKENPATSRSIPPIISENSIFQP